MKLIPIVSALSTFSCAFVINKRAKQKVPKSGQAVKNKGTGGQAATKPVVPTAFFNRFKWSTSGSKKLTTAEIKELGISSLAKKLGISRGDLFITSSIVDSAGVSHLYYKRKSLGIEIRYQESAVHILNGQVIAMSGVANAPSLKDDMVSRALISAASASKIASATYGIKAVGSPRLLYIQAYEDNNDYEHVFEVELLDTIEGKHMMVLVNARDGTIIITNSFIKSYSYNVISLPNVSPYEGGFQDVYDPERNSSSPNGWSINDTSSGNNAHVAFYRDGSTLTSEDGRFGTTWQSDQKPSKAQNVKAAIANAFYAVNMVHDISYQYGFNEVAGNFQNKNFGRGQGGNDEVKVLIQDYRASSNAWFGVGPDGFPGILSLGLFDLGSETRDSALDNSIIIHEYSHGITARLTGGKRAYYCLSGIIPNGICS